MDTLCNLITGIIEFIIGFYATLIVVCFILLLVGNLIK